MVLRFFFFENTRLNFALYFTITTIILILGPERFVPGLKKSRESPQIDAPCGSLKGRIMTSRRGRILDSYRAIPFAKPPIGSLRFARPEPLEDPAWTGVLDAGGSIPSCYQPKKMVPIFGNLGSEDCLYLNVYRPADIDRKTQLPVMVWFHGGGFVLGSSDTLMYAPGYLLDRDVILVTANYRLGVLGFLTLGAEGEDVDVQGNQGLWDQVEVLKWVRKNIRSFGGDPKRVTIFGESAGGMSISYHLTSKASRGLFQAAIVQSGPLYTPFVKGDYNKPLPEVHKEFISAVGCPIVDGQVSTAVKCLKSKTPEELNAKLMMFDQCNLHEPGMFPFPATFSHTDDSMTSSKPFFGGSPYEVLKSGNAANVATMIGFMREDGLLITTAFLKHRELLEQLKSNWSLCGPSNLLGANFGNHENPKFQQLSDKIRRFYLGHDRLDVELETDFENLTRMFTDASFGYGSEMMIRDLASQGRQNLFYYIFEHRGSFSISDHFKSTPWEIVLKMIGKMLGFHVTDKLGACHADDLLYLFSSDMPFRMLTEDEDERMIDLMVDLWTNFATYHDPTPSLVSKAYQATDLLSGDRVRHAKWPAVTAKSATSAPPYARLNGGHLVTDRDADIDKRFNFWRENVEKHILFKN